MRYLAFHERAVRGTFDFPIELYYVDASHPRYEMPFHWHMETELILVLEGTFELMLSGQALTLRAGDCAFVPGGAVHGGAPWDCIYECVVFDLERFLQDSVICRRKYAAVLDDNACIYPFFQAGSDVAELADALFECLEKEQSGHELLTTGLLWQLFGTILQQKLYGPPSAAAPRERQRIEKIKSALRMIRRDYASPLTLEALASQAGMRCESFCRSFRQVTGRSPIDYVNYYRVECAAELLCVTSQSVTEIALSCGFNDLTYFSRVFRRHKGVSPRTYREQHADALHRL